MDLSAELEKLKGDGEAPDWMTLNGYITISKGYRLKGETPKMMYKRVAMSAARALGKQELSDKFFKAMWNNWLCPASPVLANMGTDRGLPISCYGIDIDDSVEAITKGIFELSMLSKNGGGVGVNFQRIRPRGALIKNGANGKTDGIISFAKMYDSTIIGISQGSTRRGAASINVNIEHGDWEEFIRMRRPEGDKNRQCDNLHHCTFISDEFMHKMLSGDVESRIKWVELMRARKETGESYIAFYDNINKVNPLAYQNKGLSVEMTNICSEITLFTDPDHSFICCLSSLNLMRWDEWKNTDLVETATQFLNGVLNEFIEKAKYLPGFDKVVASAVKGRAIGIGVLGWHSLLQSKNLPFAGFQSMMLNAEIFRTIQERATKMSKVLASEFGEPEWCQGTGQYNTHLVAVAPTKSNSVISGDVSAGIEPLVGNAYVEESAKGSFIRRNPAFMKVLEKYGKHEDSKLLKDIARKDGSVQHLNFLTDEEKKVFLTAYEIDQFAIVQQAAQRQKWICQSQSLNLFFPTDADPIYFNKVHVEAWKLGVKTLYYCFSESSLKSDVATRDECVSCEG